MVHSQEKRNRWAFDPPVRRQILLLPGWFSGPLPDERDTSRNQRWRTIHIYIDAETFQVRAAPPESRRIIRNKQEPSHVLTISGKRETFKPGPEERKNRPAEEIPDKVAALVGFARWGLKGMLGGDNPAIAQIGIVVNIVLSNALSASKNPNPIRSMRGRHRRCRSTGPTAGGGDQVTPGHR